MNTNPARAAGRRKIRALVDSGRTGMLAPAVTSGRKRRRAACGNGVVSGTYAGNGFRVPVSVEPVVGVTVDRQALLDANIRLQAATPSERAARMLVWGIRSADAHRPGQLARPNDEVVDQPSDGCGGDSKEQT